VEHDHINPLKALLLKWKTFMDLGNLLGKIFLILLTPIDVLDLSGEVSRVFTSGEFTVLLTLQSL
jgi:hypothetical protein